MSLLFIEPWLEDLLQADTSPSHMFSGQGQQAFQTLDGQQIASYPLKEG
jgi:hypothetical protein